MYESQHLRPAPARLRGTLKTDDESQLHRNLHCVHYDGCLDHALALAWPSWSCQTCALAEIRPGPELDRTFHATRRLG